MVITQAREECLFSRVSGTGRCLSWSWAISGLPAFHVLYVLQRRDCDMSLGGIKGL